MQGAIEQIFSDGSGGKIRKLYKLKKTDKIYCFAMQAVKNPKDLKEKAKAKFKLSRFSTWAHEVVILKNKKTPAK